MKLTNIVGQRVGGELELILELDGIHYEAQRFHPNTDAADLADRLRHLAARIEHRAGVATVAPRDIAPMIDAAMTEMSNIHPPLRRSECERLIRAALGVPELDPRPPFDRTVAAAIVREAWAWAVHGLDDPRNRTEAPAAEPSDSAIEGILVNVAVSLPCGVKGPDHQTGDAP